MRKSCEVCSSALAQNKALKRYYEPNLMCQLRKQIWGRVYLGCLLSAEIVGQTRPYKDGNKTSSIFPEKTSGDTLATVVIIIVRSGIKLKRDSNMNLSKLFSSVGLASMVAMTTIVASPKPKAVSAQLAPQNSIILVNSGETVENEIPTADSLVVSDIPQPTVSSVEIPQEDSDVETFHATAPKTVEQPLDSRVFAQDSDGFKVFQQQQQEPEQKPAFSIRIKSPEEIFRSASFYVLIGFVLLVVAIMFFVEILKFIVWIILLPLKILLSLFR